MFLSYWIFGAISWLMTATEIQIKMREKMTEVPGPGSGDICPPVFKDH